MRDEIFKEPKTVTDFSFNEEVASVFPDMLNRSIPGYGSILDILAIITKTYAKPSTNLYDLGASLGSVSKILREFAPNTCKVIAIDNSCSMTKRCTDILNAQSLLNNQDLAEFCVICDDISNLNASNASMSVLNFTLQFVTPNLRQHILEKIYHSLNAEGVLIISEKVRFLDPKTMQTIDNLHLNFKKQHGYSDLEIMQKRQSLEKVMKLDTIADHINRLQNVGFNNVFVWHQNLNFVSIFAQKL